MARTQVQSELLAVNSISGTIIADNAITATHIATNAISGTLVQDGGIVTVMIAANNVTATKIVTDAVQTRHIADDQVTEAKLANAINTSIAAKLPLAGGTMTGDLTTNGDIIIDNSSGDPFLKLKTSAQEYVIRIDQSDSEKFQIRDVTDSATRITLDGSGKVGIGDTSPFAKLHVEDTGWSSGAPYGAVAYIQGGAVNDLNWGHLLISQSGTTTDTGGRLAFGANGENPIAGIRAKYKGATYGDLAFLTRPSGGTNTERMVIDSSGNVGIGNTNPQHPLSVHLTNGQLAMFGSNGMNSPGQYAGIGLGQVLANNTTYQKVAIVAEGRNSGSYVSNLHFLVDTAADSGSAVLSDAKLTIEGGNGNVGIGESAPHEKLHVTGASGNTLLLHMDADTAGGTNILGFKNDSTNDDRRIKAGIIFQRDDPGTRGTGDLHICVNGVNSDTNVSVSDSKMAFYASGESAITGGTFYVSGEGNAFAAGSHNGMQFAINGQSVSSRAATNTQTHKSFYNPNGSVGTITTSGTGTTYGGTSDYRLKENVVTDWDGTTLLKQLKPSKFNFKADADTIIQGFLAHEVSSIVPEAVVGEKDAVYTAEEAAEDIIAVEGQPKYQQIDHSKLVPLLVKTIQELEARIATLEG